MQDCRVIYFNKTWCRALDVGACESSRLPLHTPPISYLHTKGAAASVLREVGGGGPIDCQSLPMVTLCQTKEPWVSLPNNFVSLPLFPRRWRDSNAGGWFFFFLTKCLVRLFWGWRSLRSCYQSFRSYRDKVFFEIKNRKILPYRG